MIIWFGDGAEEVVGGSRQQWVEPAPKTRLCLFHAWKIVCNTNTQEASQINLLQYGEWRGSVFCGKANVCANLLCIREVSSDGRSGGGKCPGLARSNGCDNSGLCSFASCDTYSFPCEHTFQSVRQSVN